MAEEKLNLLNIVSENAKASEKDYQDVEVTIKGAFLTHKNANGDKVSADAPDADPAKTQLVLRTKELGNKFVYLPVWCVPSTGAESIIGKTVTITGYPTEYQDKEGNTRTGVNWTSLVAMDKSWEEKVSYLKAQGISFSM